MQAPRSGEYQKNRATLKVVRRDPFLDIEIEGETFTFNEAGILLAAEPTTANETEDLQSGRPRVKVPEPPKWPRKQ